MPKAFIFMEDIRLSPCFPTPVCPCQDLNSRMLAASRGFHLDLERCANIPGIGFSKNYGSFRAGNNCPTPTPQPYQVAFLWLFEEYSHTARTRPRRLNRKQEYGYLGLRAWVLVPFFWHCSQDAVWGRVT